jgi:hypothetical protein
LILTGCGSAQPTAAEATAAERPKREPDDNIASLEAIRPIARLVTGKADEFKLQAHNLVST